MSLSTQKIQLPRKFERLFQPARYKAFYGGRGSGKSHSFAAALLILGGQKPLRILCGREVQKSIKESVKQLLDDKIRAMEAEDFYLSLQQEIRGKNGTHFTFAGIGNLTIDQIKSYEGVDIFWGEEAQTFTKYSLETLIPTIRRPDSELWFSWNPRHATDPVDERFRGDHPPPDSIIERVNYHDNPFFPDVLEQDRLYDLDVNRVRYGHIWDGDYEPQAVGAIFNSANIARNRRAPDEVPELGRIVVAVDPSTTEEGNEHGIVACGKGDDERGYVLEDASTKGPPLKWARRAVALFNYYDADCIVAEKNQGGDMVKSTLRTIDPNIPVLLVSATRAKHVRAEPISALYELDKISHVGAFPELERQMCLTTKDGYEGEDSPDRMDAMVWGFTELFPRLVKKSGNKGRRPGKTETAKHNYRRGLRG